jgi:hypothetical protein
MRPPSRQIRSWMRKPISFICRLQHQHSTTILAFSTRLTGVCRQFVTRPCHIAFKPRDFPLSGDSCPMFSTIELRRCSVHKFKAGALAHALPRWWIRESIERNSFSGTATSAIWKTVILEWKTIPAPILMSLSCALPYLWDGALREMTD